MILKKTLFFIMLSCFLSVSFSQENAIANAINQENIIIESVKHEPQDNQDNKISIPLKRGWSFGVGFGVTKFRGDVSQYDHYPAYQETTNFFELRTAMFFNFEKRINPFYSLSTELSMGQFAGLRRVASYEGYIVYEPWPNRYEGQGDKFVASFYEADLIVNLRITNLLAYFFKTRTGKYFTVDGKFGYGFNMFNSLRTNLFTDTYIHDFGYEMEGAELGTQKKSFFQQTNESVYVYGVRANYKLNRKMDLHLDYTVRNGLTDKWDASLMSTQYPTDNFTFISIGASYNIGNHDYKNDWESPIEGLKTDVDKLFVQIDGFTDDADNDGVSDAFDKSANTPLGVAVDGAGIALDVDMDHVPDYRDADPFSFRGAIVDENGVELDDDKDGVPNSKDLESNTRIGAMVNQFGINVSNTAHINRGEMIYFPSVYFNSGSSVVVTSNKNRLATIALILKSNPDVQMKVIGHTDIIGDSDFNKKLGLKRANAVINYLYVHYSIDSTRLIPETKGEESPLSNKTQTNIIEDGSSTDSFLEMNRRVDFDIIH